MNYYGVVTSGCSINYYVAICQVYGKVAMWQCLWIATTWLVLVNCWCLAGMGDPSGLIYPPGYGSGEIPPPMTVYGDTHSVILLSRVWVWGVHTRWGFTHYQRYARWRTWGKWSHVHLSAHHIHGEGRTPEAPSSRLGVGYESCILVEYWLLWENFYKISLKYEHTVSFIRVTVLLCNERIGENGWWIDWVVGPCDFLQAVRMG